MLFTLIVSCPVVLTCGPAHRRRAINPLTASQFSAALKDTVLYVVDDGDLSVEDFTVLFDCNCTEILDSIALLKSKRTKALSELWLNDYKRFL